MDIQSVFWFLSSWGPVSQAAAIQAVLKQEQEHRALPDARNTARLFRFLAERFLPRLHEDTAVSFDTLNPST
jgi:hypothetical protein